jgi:hypothetical protein
MPSLPSFPTTTLYTGTFPAFPTTSWGWGFTIFGIHEGFTITLPNFLAIPQWIAGVVTYGVLWTFGWIGAIYEFAVKYAAIGIQNLTTEAISFTFGTYDKILSTIEGITGNTGIVAPLLTILIISALAVGTLYVLIMAFNAIRSIA